MVVVMGQECVNVNLAPKRVALPLSTRFDPDESKQSALRTNDFEIMECSFDKQSIVGIWRNNDLEYLALCIRGSCARNGCGLLKHPVILMVMRTAVMAKSATIEGETKEQLRLLAHLFL
jgi:hypothetical protein